MTRRAWVLIVTGYVVLALGFLGVTVVLSRQQDHLEKQTGGIKVEQKQIERNQRQIMATQRLLLNLTKNTAGALCLVALANEKQERILVRVFNTTHTIDVSKSPECTKAINGAIRLILKP